MKQLLNKIWPMCPQGGHRIRLDLVTNIKGNKYCWHKDCIDANFVDIQTPRKGEKK